MSLVNLPVLLVSRAHLDLLPLLREKVLRDGVDVYYDHCHYSPESHEYFANAVVDFLLREVFSP